MKLHATSITLVLALLPLSYTQSVVAPSPSAPAIPSPGPSSAEPVPVPPSNTPIPPSGTPSSDLPPSITEPSTPPSQVPSDVGSVITTLPPSGSVNASITSTFISSILNASMTSTSLAPNATATSNSTANATAPELVGDESDGWLGAEGDASPPPADFQADEQVVNLVYAANYDKSECLSLAQSYASGSTPMLRRHWAEIAYRRKRQQLPLKCLPAAYTIPVTIHWFPPKGVDRSKWVNTKSLTSTILATQNKLGIMNAAMDIRDRWVWPSNDNTEKFTMNVKDNMAWAIGYIKSIREKMGTNQYDHLNIFLVQSAGDGLNGFANFPGTSALSSYPDAVVLSVHTLLGNKYGAYDATKKPYHGTTMAHEVGHWLGLFHPHAGGCSGNDYEPTTPQYPEGWGDYTCDKTYVGTRGSQEHNIMAYSDGRTMEQGTFGRGQARRAAAGWAIRRSGMKSGKINDGKWYTNKCVNKYRRDLDNSTEIETTWDNILIPRQLPSLSKRQLSSQLSAFCDSPDLTIPNYQFSSLAQTGLYNSDSPPIQGAPAIVQAQSVDVGTQAVEAGGEKSNNFDAVQAQVQQRVEQNGGAIVDGKAPAVPQEVKQDLDQARTSTGSGGGSGGGSGKSAAARKIQGGTAALGLMLAGLMGLMAF